MKGNLYVMKKILKKFTMQITGILSPKKMLIIFIGLCISSFGVYNIHQQTNITEGGVIGLILLLNHWTGMSPSILSMSLDVICYAIAFKYLGWGFIKLSAISTIFLGGIFKFWEMFPPILPNLSAYPLLAAILGGLFVGIGVGLVISQGGSGGGDDALALVISKVTGARLSRSYLITDFSVLLLSLSYIPFSRIGYSFITVIISSYLVEWVHHRVNKND